MTREQIKEEIIKIENNNVLLELATGTGKSKLAIDLMKKYNPKSLLIIVPRLILIDNWKAELKKFKASRFIPRIMFSTYVGLHKIQMYNSIFDMCICDEAHHLTDRALEHLQNIPRSRNILLSATVTRNMLYTFSYNFKDLYHYKIGLKETIQSDILPDPRVILIPLKLNNGVPTESIWKNPKGAEPVIETSYANRWHYIKQKKYKVRIYCTEQQYYNDLSETIEWYKKKAISTRNDAIKNRWLKLCGDRLKWLSDKKTRLLLELSVKLKNERVLTFCNSIEQAELFQYSIHSKDKNSRINLTKFNEGKINHISAVATLDEGVNLYNCRIGIFGMLNSSEIKVTQRNGRILRHKEPIIIIPYYVGTREEELKDKMLENYNPELIETITNINDLKI